MNGILDDAKIYDIHTMEQFLRVTGFVRFSDNAGGAGAEIHQPLSSAQRSELGYYADDIFLDLEGAMEGKNEVFIRRSIGGAIPQLAALCA